MKSDVAEVGEGGGGEARGQGEAPRPEIANRLPLALHHHRHRHRFGFGVPLSPFCAGRVFFGCTTLLELQAGRQVERAPTNIQQEAKERCFCSGRARLRRRWLMAASLPNNK